MNKLSSTQVRKDAFRAAKQAEGAFRSAVTDATFHTRWDIVFTEDDRASAIDTEAAYAAQTVAAAEAALAAAEEYLAAARAAHAALTPGR